MHLQITPIYLGEKQLIYNGLYLQELNSGKSVSQFSLKSAAENTWFRHNQYLTKVDHLAIFPFLPSIPF